MWTHRLRRHPFGVTAWFRDCLVLTYACPSEVLSGLVSPGLALETHAGFGFLAVALVQTRDLRPQGAPRALGRDFFLAGYRVFVRFRTAGGRTLRGLRILRSDADSRWMVFWGNRFTHYGYRRCRAVVASGDEQLDVRVTTPRGEADLDLTARLQPASGPPPGSPFDSVVAARRFAGPLPFTFDYEPETHSIVMIEARRQRWDPQPVTVEVRESTFLRRPPFDRCRPILAGAFHVRNVPYRWLPGVAVALPHGPA